MEDFSKLDVAGTETTGTEAPVIDEKKAAKKAKMVEMANLLKDTITRDESYQTRVRSLTDSIAVVNTLGYGDSGNIVVDQNAKPAEGKTRALVSTSQIVGYKIQNNGAQPIKYMTEVYAKNEQGVWVGQKTEKILEPGAYADLTRKYMTIFCAQPEISFQLANGKIIRGSGSVKSGDIDAELEAHYFVFSDKDAKVNSDTIKLNVAKKGKTEDGTTKWIVKDEFAETFGYLNNAKTSSKRTRGSKAAGSKYNGQDMAANYIYRMLQESQNM